MRHIIIGTAGHVDHGKTALIMALTGIETDRLREEKERGLSIDLGFAYFDLPGGQRAGIIDVPGHERFIRNMLAGAVGMDLVLLVVAADEGVMPQTREHLDILRILDIENGLIVINKMDLADEEQISFVEEDVKETVEGTFLQQAPVLRVSAKTGEGIENLKAAIQQSVQHIQAKSERGYFRLPIDRVFVMKGFGTVLTGTVFSGSVGVGDTLELLPTRRKVRVRGVQVHNQKVEKAYAGQRTALNVPDVEKSDVSRGDVLATPGVFGQTQLLDARIVLLEGDKKSLADRTHVHFHLGTTQVPAQIFLLEGKEIESGNSALARIRLEEPIVALRGDRFVLRKPLPVATIGGGRVVDIRPQKFRRKETERRKTFLQTMESDHLGDIVRELIDHRKSVFAIVDLQSYLNVGEEELAKTVQEMAAAGLLRRFTKEHREVFIGSRPFQQLLDEGTDIVKKYLEANPYKKGISKEEIRSRLGLADDPVLFDEVMRELQRTGKIAMQEGKVAPAGRTSFLTPEQEKLKEALEKMYLGKIFEPPAIEDIEKRLGKGTVLKGMLSLLVEEGALVRTAGNILFHRRAIEEAMDHVKRHIREHGSITVAQFRDRFQTSRKYSLAILEYFDRIHLTRRIDDERELLDEEAKIT